MHRYFKAFASALSLLFLTACTPSDLDKEDHQASGADDKTPASSVSFNSGAEQQAVRIVTFNAEILTAPRARGGSIQRFRFDVARTAHLERVAGIIEVLNPDILNLVEVTSIEAVDMLIEMLHEKGMKDYKGYHIESNDSFTGMDVALITRIAPDKVDGKMIRTIYSDKRNNETKWRESYTFTERNGEEKTRDGSLSRNSLYYITVSGQKLGFFGLHLKSNPQDNYSNARRVAEVKIVNKVIKEEILAKGYMPVILGDINDYDPDVPDRDDTRSTSTTVLRDLKDYDQEKDGDELVNVAERIERIADRYTSHWDTNENGAEDGDDVYTMIDHILLPKELMPYVKRAFIARCLDLSTSDHFPVVVDLMLPKEKTKEGE